jgi:hypothetical protein
VSVNGSSSSVIFRGMPLLVSSVFVSAGAADCRVPPLLLSAGTGAWTNAVTLEIQDVTGKLQSWPFHTAITPSNSVALDCVRYAQIDWWLTPTETSLLATGSYSVGLVLNTTNAVELGAWKGMIRALAANVQIIDEPATLTEAQAENKYSQLASYHLFAGNGQTALHQIETLLAAFPTNITGLQTKALVLDSLGQATEAYRACEQAISQVYARNPTPQEPPVELLELQRQLQTTLVGLPVVECTLTNQQVQLSWSGFSGTNYRLETSVDLRTWSLLSTNFTILGNRYSFVVDVVRDRQFFRIAR